MIVAKYLGVCTIFGYMMEDSFQLYISLSISLILAPQNMKWVSAPAAEKKLLHNRRK